MNGRHARPRNLPGPGRVPATWGALRVDANRTALDLEASCRARHHAIGDWVGAVVTLAFFAALGILIAAVMSQ